MKNLDAMAWTCSVEIDPLEAYLLAMFVRLYACREVAPGNPAGHKYLLTGERHFHSPTALTKEHVDLLGGIWAYVCAMAHKHGLKTTDEVNRFMADDEMGPEKWMDEHPARVRATYEFLSKLVGKFVCYG